MGTYNGDVVLGVLFVRVGDVRATHLGVRQSVTDDVFEERL